MKAIKIFGKLFLAAMFLISVSTLAQEKNDSTKLDHKMMKHDQQMMHNMMQDSSMQYKMQDTNGMGHGTTAMLDSSAIRKGVIDLKAIDKNKDGKVFQDQMDWNVISDKPGECPLCGMKLKEVTLEKAKENLLKHNFKVKEN